LNIAFSTTTLQEMGTCMPFGNGDLLKQIAGSTGSEQITNLSSLFTNMTTFNLSSYLTPIDNNMTALLTTTGNYGLSKLMDLTDTTALSALTSLASPTGTNCNSNLAKDSWVPSNSQLNTSSTIISCTVASGDAGNSSTCSSGLSSTVSCKGCMDSAEVLFRYLTPSSSLPTDLSLRYGSICSFNTALNNVWTKYYKVKETAIGPTVGGTASSSGVYPRGSQVQTDISSLNSTVNPALPNLFSSITTSSASIVTLLDSNTGIVGGLNCSLVGQDAVRVINTSCSDPVDNMYLVRLATGIISYFLLVSLCCIVCFGNRHARLMDRITVIPPPPREQPYLASD
jgi:hypothetical protein